MSSKFGKFAFICLTAVKLQGLHLQANNSKYPALTDATCSSFFINFQGYFYAEAKYFLTNNTSMACQPICKHDPRCLCSTTIRKDFE